MAAERKRVPFPAQFEMSELLTTTPRIFCFVLMPLDEAFDDVYHLGIKDSCHEAGAYCERVDEQIFHESILDRIYNQISKADVVIADMTGRNPNVFYEVGYAHALGKATILLTQKEDDIPFDLKHFPHIIYEAKLLDLRAQLTKRVRWIVENPPEPLEVSKDEFELFIKEKRLDSKVAEFQYSENEFPHVQVTLHNTSSKVLEPGFLKAAFISSPELYNLKTTNVISTILPDGRLLHRLPDFPALFPDEYAPIVLVFQFAPGFDHKQSLTLRLFTKRGPRDFPISVAKRGNPRVGPKDNPV
jgi:hypothetical protein